MDQLTLLLGIYVAGLDRVLGSWLWPGPTLPIADMWEANKQKEDLSLSAFENKS